MRNLFDENSKLNTVKSPNISPNAHQFSSPNYNQQMVGLETVLPLWILS